MLFRSEMNNEKYSSRTDFKLVIFGKKGKSKERKRTRGKVGRKRRGIKKDKGGRGEHRSYSDFMVPWR